MSAWRDSAGLIALQLGGALLLTVPAMTLLGACAGWVPVVGILLASFLWALWWGARRPGFLTRTRIRRLAMHSGAVHVPLVGLAYVSLYFAMPDAFEFPAYALLLLAPTLGFAGGLVAAVLTLCAGDGAAAALGTQLEPDGTGRG